MKQTKPHQINAPEYIKMKHFSFVWSAPVEQKTLKTPKFQPFILSPHMQAQL